MSKTRLTRRELFATAAPLVAGGLSAEPGRAGDTPHHPGATHGALGHAAMIGAGVPDPAGRVSWTRCSIRLPPYPTATPLKKHIAKGLYGALIVDPREPRKPAQELVMVMNGFDTDGDGENNFYTVNGKVFYYTRYPIAVSRSQTVRVYLANLTQFDLINSIHLHGDFFHYYPTGRTEGHQYTDTIVLTEGQRGILEIDFANSGLFMFHAHQSEFTELGWMSFFDVRE